MFFSGLRNSLQFPHDREYAFSSSAMDIMAQLEPLCEALDLDQEDHADHPARRALAHQKQLITDHTLTPSAQLLAEMQAAGESFSSYALHKSKEHQATLIRMRAEKRAKFEKEAKKSIEKQRNMEVGKKSHLSRFGKNLSSLDIAHTKNP